MPGFDVCGQAGVGLTHSGHMVGGFVGRKLSLSAQVVYKGALKPRLAGATSIPSE